MAKLIKRQDGQTWTLEVPNNKILRICPNGNTGVVQVNDVTKNIVCDKVQF